MCEHELKQALLDIEFLQECNNSANLALSVTRKELAAANTNNKALREENELLRHKAAGHDTTMLRTELAAANARIAELEQQQFAGQTWVTFDEHMKALKKIKQMEDAIKFDYERFMEFQQRAEQAEAQNKRMQTAINRYVIGNIELLDALKAALEEKP